MMSALCGRPDCQRDVGVLRALGMFYTGRERQETRADTNSGAKALRERGQRVREKKGKMRVGEEKEREKRGFIRDKKGRSEGGEKEREKSG